MNLYTTFVKHYELEGKHAFFSPSSPAWMNYSEQKAAEVYSNHLAAARGTRLHALAAEHIGMKIKMPRTQNTLDAYINDSIGYRMTPEVVLKYSDNFFGTTDAIAYDIKNKVLRINDYKSGVTPADMRQLYAYAALFCLEYGINPESIRTELRLYQNNDILLDTPSGEDIIPITNKIILLDKVMDKVKSEI